LQGGGAGDEGRFSTRPPQARIREPAVTPGRFEKALRIAIQAGLGVALLVACASAVWMSLAADEAWILYGINGLVEHGKYSVPYGTGAVTTGGLHTIVEFVLAFVAGRSVPVARAFPLACLALMLWGILSWARRAGMSTPAAFIVGCVVIGIPGTLTLAGSAFAAVPAAFLIVSGVRLWDPIGGGGLKRRWASAAICGLAAATRLQCLVILPALLLGSRLRRKAGPDIAAGGLGLVVGAALFAACFAGLMSLTDSVDRSMAHTKLSLGFDVGAIVSRLVEMPLTASRLAAIPFLIAASLVPRWLERDGFGESERLRVLVWFGWMSWAVWLLAAPIPHLRYLWPGLAAIACVLGFGLGQLYERGRKLDSAARRIAASLIGVACLVFGIGGGIRNLAVGDLNVVIWEWRQLIPRGEAGFGSLGDQAKMAEHLRRLPAHTRIGTPDHPVELAFLSRRWIQPLSWYRTPQFSADPVPDLILITPHLGNRVHPPPALSRWLQNGCDPEVRFGAHVLCRIRGSAPKNLARRPTR